MALALEADGFIVEQFTDGLAALIAVSADPPALMVLELSLPGLGGLEVLRRVRAAEAATMSESLPVIVLSGGTCESERILGLDSGADDYLVKPFSPDELAARTRAVLRRSRLFTPPRAGVRVDEASRDVEVDGEHVELTAKEFDLLSYLVARPKRVLSRTSLLVDVWGSEVGWQSEATVTEHIHRLRRKIEKSPHSPTRLRTIRGVGYRWEP